MCPNLNLTVRFLSSDPPSNDLYSILFNVYCDCIHFLEKISPQEQGLIGSNITASEFMVEGLSQLQNSFKCTMYLPKTSIISFDKFSCAK